jgi:outer membrane protein assembly factor BamB
MRRNYPALSGSILALALVSGPVIAAGGAVDRIDLPPGWQPEGITTDGSALFVGSLADGAIWHADPATGEGQVLVEGVPGKVAVGVEHEAGQGRLWVAGGATGEVRTYDVSTGELLGTFPVDAGFLNDAAVTPEAAYITDSFMQQLVVVPLGAEGQLPDLDAVTVLPISGDLEYGDGFNVNGIVSTDAGLVVVHSGSGDLYRIDPASGESTRIDIGDAALSAGDGLELDAGTLYVVRNQFGQVVALELDEDVTRATAVGNFTSSDLDVPATAALVGEDLWAVNARFGTAAGPETEYWITRLPLAGASDD